VGYVTLGAWGLLLPPLWFASLLEPLWGQIRFLPWGLLILAVTLVVAGRVGLRYFSLSYLALLQEGGEVSASRSRGGRSRKWLFGLCTKALTASREERAGFEFTLSYISRSRFFKMRFLPGLGIVLAMLVVMAWRGQLVNPFQSATGAWQSYLVPYLLVLLLLVMLLFVDESDQWRAGWVFFCTPVDDINAFVRGCRKALMVYTAFPVVLIMLLVLTLRWQSFVPAVAHCWPILLLLYLGTASLGLLMRRPPFTREPHRGMMTAKMMMALVGAYFLLGPLLLTVAMLQVRVCQRPRGYAMLCLGLVIATEVVEFVAALLNRRPVAEEFYS
jgi:hypothetical protein